jgi:glucose-6-phosphate 1-dehydrogenase
MIHAVLSIWLCAYVLPSLALSLQRSPSRSTTHKLRSLRATQSTDAHCNIATALVILGGVGDLARGKIIPSLQRLYRRGGLPSSFRVIGCSRSSLSHEEYRGLLQSSLTSDSESHAFLNLVHFSNMPSYDVAETYHSLDAELLSGFSRKIFYFALPPHQFEGAIDALLSSGIDTSNIEVVLEKPVGRDLKSCTSILDKLDRQILSGNRFLVDHYLGKEVILNILQLRFGSGFLERSFNRECVSHIEVEFKEKNMLLGEKRPRSTSKKCY